MRALDVIVRGYIPADVVEYKARSIPPLHHEKLRKT